MCLVFFTLSHLPLLAQSSYVDQSFRKRPMTPVNDSIFLLFDRDSLPGAYVQDVFMPVCSDTLCKPVYMSLFWDLSGNYLEYRIDKDLPLTKLDHKPFLLEDYKRLHTILSNKHSILRTYTPEQIASLVKREPNSENPEVDGVSGATPYEIRQETVEGALYTCHTLWQYCHGEVQTLLRKYTEAGLLNEQVLRGMLSSGQTNLVLFAVEQMEYFDAFIFQNDLLAAVRGNNPSLVKQVLSVFPSKLIINKEFARSFWDLYRYIHISCQEELLTRFSENTSIPASVIDEMLMSTLYTREEQFVLFMEVFLSQEHLSPAQEEQIERMLKERGGSLSKQAQESIQKLSKF